MSEERRLEAWAEGQRRDWESYASTKYRDYFVASHRGWDDRERWEAQAVYDASVVLYELDAQRLAGLEVLEIGCGVGRLARVIAPRVRGYTGIDIAPGMIEEARARCAELGNTRFVLADGLRVPLQAGDRRYGLAFAFAVFIHCPRDVIASLIQSASALLAPGGELRFQLRADPSDSTGIRPVAEAPIDVPAPHLDFGTPTETEIQTLREAQEVTLGRPYMGAVFRYEEVEPFLRGLRPDLEARVQRYDPEHMYVDLIHP